MCTVFIPALRGWAACSRADWRVQVSLGLCRLSCSRWQAWEQRVWDQPVAVEIWSAWAVWLWMRLSWGRRPCAKKVPRDLLRLVGVEGQMERDQMKCAVQVLCKSAPVYTSNSTYQYILVRTCMYYILYLLVLSCNIPSCTCLGILVLPGTILYCLVPMGKSFTCLYSLVPNLGYLVLAGTVLYRLVLGKSCTCWYHLVPN